MDIKSSFQYRSPDFKAFLSVPYTLKPMDAYKLFAEVLFEFAKQFGQDELNDNR